MDAYRGVLTPAAILTSPYWRQGCGGPAGSR